MMSYVNFPITNQVFFQLEKKFLKKNLKTNTKNFFITSIYYARKGLVVLATSIAVLALPCLISADCALKIGISFKRRFYPVLNDCHFLFNSTVFNSYIKQLQAHINVQLKTKPLLLNLNKKQENSLVNVTGELIEIILKGPKGEKESDKRTFHQTFIDIQRQAISLKREYEATSDPLIKEACHLIDHLSDWLYTKNYLLEDMVKFLESKAGDSFKKETLPNAVFKINEFFKKSKEFSGIVESCGRLYDPLHLGDLPSFLYDFKLEDGHVIKIIRTPSVTKDKLRDRGGNLIDVEVVDEFLNLLQMYPKQGKKHLYVNLMQRHSSEGLRSQKIENLETNPKIKDHIYTVTLAKDGHFYWQRNKYTHQSNFKIFKENFLKEMFKPENSDYYWSKQLKMDEWKKRCEEIIDSVHSTSFKSVVSLSHQQRLDFIEITHNAIILDLMKTFKPTTFNMACKSCIDRGASANAILYLTCLEKQGKKIDEKAFAESMAIAFCPAALTQNRAILQVRPPRLRATLARIFGDGKLTL